MFETDQDSFSKREEKVLDFWNRHAIFEASLQSRQNAPIFSMYDGPPFATGLPHYGHLLTGTIKDVIPRYQTMRGKCVPRRFGWDTHGLPIESEIEKMHRLSSPADIERFGIARFNEECRKIVLRFTSQWQDMVQRMGRWVCFEKAYMTMLPSYMESVWWIFKRLWEMGFVYEGVKVMPFSTRLATPLSNFEANLNYRDVQDPSITVSFPLADDPTTSFLIWTTTPWTLPMNLAIMVRADLKYAKVRRGDKCYIVCSNYLKTHFKEDCIVLATFLGQELVGKRYLPLFEYFSDARHPKRFHIIAEPSVDASEGTGLVHAAPAFGEVDFFACQRAGIDWVCPVDENGRYTDEIAPLSGILVKDADMQLIEQIKDKGRLLFQATLRHRYPFCWRSDTPLIYKAVQTWFVAVEKIKKELIDNNMRIHWVPGHLKEGRFGKWLENARDWAISRNRYWGTPIPLWRSEQGKIIPIGSIKELEQKTGAQITDLHRDHIDSLTFTEEGQIYTRIPEVFDCWFESGAMPFAQDHYPFEKGHKTLDTFPADFIAEGLDQTRGWFYTLNVLSTALFNQPAFRNVIVNGIVLAEDGAKMSKRLQNYPDPKGVIDKYGADAMRLYMLNSPAMQGDDVCFSEKGVELILRKSLIPFWNAYLFLSTYAKIYKWVPEEVEFTSKYAIDRWIVSKLQKLIDEVTKSMDGYLLMRAVSPFVQFIDQLTNWYIRRNRTRFWENRESESRSSAFQTLYFVLRLCAHVTAPFIPFISEAIYRGLRMRSDPISVHLCDFPCYQARLRDPCLESEMHLVHQVTRMVHALRKKQALKVRQPLRKLCVVACDGKLLCCLQRHQQLLLDELNVKMVEYSSQEENIVTTSIRPNFKNLGKRAGPLMDEVQKAILSLPPHAPFDRPCTLKIAGKPFVITKEDVVVKREIKAGLIALSEGDLTVILDVTLDETLRLEGLAREIVNKINTQRRNMRLEVTDRIKMVFDTTEGVRACFATYKDYIFEEVLATEVQFKPTPSGTRWQLNNEWATIALEKM